MDIRLPDDKNPYSKNNPFAILGVDSTVTADELKDAKDYMLDEIDEDNPTDQNIRLSKRKQVTDAYEALRKPADRARLALFFFDRTLGEEQCRRTAERHETLTFEYDRILERVDEIIPSTLDLKDASKGYRDVKLSRSTRLKTEGHAFAVDARQEALKFITFER